jgi:hypothetical protein
LPLDNRASDYFGILIMNGIAVQAHKAVAMIALWYSFNQRMTAVTAKFHGIPVLYVDKTIIAQLT